MNSVHNRNNSKSHAGGLGCSFWSGRVPISFSITYENSYITICFIIISVGNTEKKIRTSFVTNCNYLLTHKRKGCIVFKEFVIGKYFIF